MVRVQKTYQSIMTHHEKWLKERLDDPLGSKVKRAARDAWLMWYFTKTIWNYHLPHNRLKLL